MKIGMVLDEVFPPDPRVENEAVSLIKAGHQVFLFCLKYTDVKQSEIINGIQVDRYQSSNLEYKLSALAYTLPFYSFLMQKKVNRFIVKHALDAIHIHDIRIAEAVFKANKKFKLPVILDLHENRPEIMQFYPHLSKFPGKFLISPKKWKAKEEEFLKKADKVIVVTKESKQEILQRVKVHPNKIIDLPNTVRQDFFKYENSFSEISKAYKNKFVMLYIGDTGVRRGLKTAIKATKTLKKSIQNFKLVIVGKNSSDTILKQLVKDLNVEAYVDFLGWQDPKYFSTYILLSSVCISPLHRNLHHDTTYANKIFQYMSFGRSLLVSDATAQKQVVKKANSGLIHREKDVEDFIKKTLILYRNESLRNELGENGKRFVREDFSWEKKSKKLINLYDILLG